MRKILPFVLLLIPVLLFSQAQRKTLIEEFTNASCIPCAAQNPDFNVLLSNNLAKVVPIKYQTRFPGYDPMNRDNPGEVQVREDYYAIDGVPTATIDGVKPGDSYGGGIGEWDIAGGGYEGGPYGYNQAVIDYAQSQTTPLVITLDHALTEDFDTVTIQCVVKNVSTEPFSLAQGRLHIALIEEDIRFSEPPGSTDEYLFFWVMRKMYPNAGGTVLGDIAPGDSLTFTMEEAVPDYIYSFAEIGVVAFVQDNTDKKVYQAEISTPKAIASYYDVSVASLTEAPTALCGALVTPSVKIKNEGTETVTSLEAGYLLNDNDPVLISWADTLRPGEEITINFDPVELPGGSSQILYFAGNLNQGVIDINRLNNIPPVQTFSALSQTPAGTELDEDNEDYDFGYPTSAVVIEPIGPADFGWGSFTVVSRADLTNNAGDAIGGYGMSDRSIWINYYQWNPAEPEAADDGSLIYQKIDLTGANAAQLIYDRAGARYQASNDRLQVLVSEDCADTWTVVQDIKGAQLSTVDGHTENFFLPRATQWETDTIDLTAYANSPGINIRFRAISDWGNNAYLDNIRLMGMIVGTGEPINLLEGKVAVFPNPTPAAANIEFELASSTYVTIEVFDAVGKLVSTLENGTQFPAGQYLRTWNEPVDSGVYFVRIRTDIGEKTQRIIVQK